MNVDAIETLYMFRKADVANLKGYIQCRIADRVPGDIEGEGCCRCRTSAVTTCVIVHIPSGGKSPYRVLIGGRPCLSVITVGQGAEKILQLSSI